MLESTSWDSLRPHHGSQQKAFEELCCQLAAHEKVQPGSCFVRKGDPDAGVECFWTLPDESEWAWQAKWFRSPPAKTQWGQLDQSVGTALEKHPRLASYTICLPIDRADPRTCGRESFMEKWHDHVAKWRCWGESKGMSVQFEYWGESEIWERLSREEHRGRSFFWFNKHLFSRQWFEDRLDEAVANAGPRYTPELNVELPIASLFGGLGGTCEFWHEVAEMHVETETSFAKARSKRAREELKGEFGQLQATVTELLSAMQDVQELGMAPMNWEAIGRLARQGGEIAWERTDILRSAIEQIEGRAASSGEPRRGADTSDLGYERHHLWELAKNLDRIRYFAESSEARLSNAPALLLVGRAGTGKTHLFCDLAGQRTRAGLPTVLLLGQHFKDGEAWSQITRLLSLDCTKEDFLGALATAAEVAGSRALILIDALNEGEGRALWPKHLAGMLETISRYPWIGIAVSVRTSYEDLIIPSHLAPAKLVRWEHHGFAGQEYEAAQAFFAYHGIEAPSVPLLVPEFQNPLFLKLLCQGLKGQGLTRIPAGLKGITAVFDFFIDSVDKKLYRPEYLNYDLKDAVVKKAVDKIAQLIAQKGLGWLPRGEAKAALDDLLSREGDENSLFRHLISEGVLAEDMFWQGETRERTEGIRFTYEHLADHLIVRCLLDKHLDREEPSLSFSLDQPLGSLVRDESACWSNAGFIDALSMQLPERTGRELVELAPWCADFPPVRQAFIEGLIWRAPQAFSDETRRYINEHVLGYEDSACEFWNALLTVASDPEHPYNADSLHLNLARLELPGRDAWWSVFLHDQHGARGAVDRLVDWAWSPEKKDHLSDESVRLCATALAWFLTTSNRYLRDRATKALGCLMTDRIQVLRQVVQAFRDVNDPYVLERVFAVAYGCAMRSRDHEGIGQLSADIYALIFENGTPPPDILVRDYARGVIELSVCRGTGLDIDMKKVRPPYHSECPAEISSEDELKGYDRHSDGMPEEERALLHLYDSVMGHGDFARYVIGTNFASFGWNSRRLGQPSPPSREHVYKDFVESLTPVQRRAWEEFSQLRTLSNLDREVSQERTEISEEGIPKLEQPHAESEQSLRKSLTKEQLRLLDQDVIPYLDDPNPYKDQDRFDLSMAQRWIFKKVLDLGWTVERFGKFDRAVTTQDWRQAAKCERIGKKYQWIAYHEFLSRISDNFEFSGSDESSRYEGPWQVTYGRDIDPSCLLTRTHSPWWFEQTPSCWWLRSPYDLSNSQLDNASWLKSFDDLPAIEPLIEVTREDDGSRWLVLEAFYVWAQPTPPGQEMGDIPRRKVWIKLKSYIVKKSDMEELFGWAKKQDFAGLWMPESHPSHHVFLGEFFWSPAFAYHDIPYYYHEGWTRGHNGEIPQEVLVATDQYGWGKGGYDCSIEDTINICLPAKFVADGMGLRCDGTRGEFVNTQGNVIAFDPSVTTPGPGALLINREEFMRFLDQNGYDILWTVVSEKNIIGGMRPPQESQGRLEITGAFRIRAGKVDGKLSPKFVSPPTGHGDRSGTG